MKPMIKRILAALLMGAVLPSVVLSVSLGWMPERQSPEETEDTAAETVPQQPSKLQIPVLMPEGQVKMALDEYLVGVVLAEIPADFEMEAKKAQAVVARTYALKGWEKGIKHAGGVCTDSTCCQAYISPEAYILKGGTAEQVTLVCRAVEETADLVLTYEGGLIEATFFSCSGGRTEDAAAVWGSSYPYLISRESPGEERAVHYTDTVYFSLGEFAQALGLDVPKSTENWVGKITYTQGGGVATAMIGGVTFQGTTLRQCLKLRSTAITMTVTADGVTVSTRGFGHRVGMSQYGADAMAVSGSSFQEILEYYYPGTVLTEYTGN